MLFPPSEADSSAEHDDITISPSKGLNSVNAVDTLFGVPRHHAVNAVYIPRGSVPERHTSNVSECLPHIGYCCDLALNVLNVRFPPIADSSPRAVCLASWPYPNHQY